MVERSSGFVIFEFTHRIPGLLPGACLSVPGMIKASDSNDGEVAEKQDTNILTDLPQKSRHRHDSLEHAQYCGVPSWEAVSWRNSPWTSTERMPDCKYEQPRPRSEVINAQHTSPTVGIVLLRDVSTSLAISVDSWCFPASVHSTTSTPSALRLVSYLRKYHYGQTSSSLWCLWCVRLVVHQ